MRVAVREIWSRFSSEFPLAPFQSWLSGGQSQRANESLDAMVKASFPPSISRYRNLGDFRASMTTRRTAVSSSSAFSNWLSTYSFFCASDNGRRNARSTRRSQNERSLPERSSLPGRLPDSLSRSSKTFAAASIAADVVAASHSFETVVPRTYPSLRSSGGKGVSTVRTSA